MERYTEIRVGSPGFGKSITLLKEMIAAAATMVIGRYIVKSVYSGVCECNLPRPSRCRPRGRGVRLHHPEPLYRKTMWEGWFRRRFDEEGTGLEVKDD